MTRTSAVVLLLLAASLGVASAFDLPRLGRKLSTLCHMDNCGVWCGPPRGAPCGVSQPPCYPPNKVDCHPDQNGGYPNQECFKYCGPNPWQQNSNQCGGTIYVCHAPPRPPPCMPPQEIRCPWNSQNRECQQFCGPQAMPQQRPSCGGKVYICEAPPPVNPPPVVNPPPQAGCMPGNSLPFGLENCVCDGAAVGSPAGLAACGRVANECASNVQPFSAGELQAVQQICDTFALDACISSAQSALVQNPGCADILRNGTPRCSPQQATSIWMDSVNQVCDPLCKDCARLG